jgi:hypothetical protein
MFVLLVAEILKEKYPIIMPKDPEMDSFFDTIKYMCIEQALFGFKCIRYHRKK